MTPVALRSGYRWQHHIHAIVGMGSQRWACKWTQRRFLESDVSRLSAYKMCCLPQTSLTAAYPWIYQTRLAECVCEARWTLLSLLRQTQSTMESDVHTGWLSVFWQCITFLVFLLESVDLVPHQLRLAVEWLNLLFDSWIRASDTQNRRKNCHILGRWAKQPRIRIHIFYLVTYEMNVA